MDRPGSADGLFSGPGRGGGPRRRAAITPARRRRGAAGPCRRRGSPAACAYRTRSARTASAASASARPSAAPTPRRRPAFEYVRDDGGPGASGGAAGPARAPVRGSATAVEEGPPMTTPPAAPRTAAWQPPEPCGVVTASLGPQAAAAVLDDLFRHGRRSAVLDEHAPGEPQWLLAELGDGRITGACPRGTWRLSCADPQTLRLSAPPLDPDGSDAWRLLGADLFSPSAQLRIGEGAEGAWLSRDADGADRLPPWLLPRDRSFLLTGWRAGPRSSRDLDGEIRFSIGRELSGTTACHPVRWQDFDVAEPAPDAAAPASAAGGVPDAVGTWISVREYWAEDSETGAVGVAFHRLTGYHAGPKPTPPVGLDAADAHS
ncbi:hypothetical protein GCM10023224_41270 [Streptomonospora halophila]|uniref:DUF4178 domain-containing protein n=2 Tax=Streptomonospora halophila TaxID=427369 RepID=A0ABP9GZI4_9ACTN